MRLTFLSASSQLTPRDVALVTSIEAAGHDLTTGRWVRSDTGPTRISPIPGKGRSRRLKRYRPEVIFPATSRMVEPADRAARELGTWVCRRPDWPTPNRDLGFAVPDRPELSVPAGFDPPLRAPWDAFSGPTPSGRHRGRTILLCYRSTPASPAHHLREALERAGVNVIVTARVDFEHLADVDAVVIVESPMPPIEFAGANRTIPVIYWVHHGEHHLEGNIRLSRRYDADLILLAHSWHLALRFDRQVQRFPFGVTAGADLRPFEQREFDMAFVGAIDGGAYARRRELLNQARAGFERVKVESDIPPTEMEAIYRNSRSVLNDGGTRHLPITMRVFEAIGAGALLVTDPAPGLDLLFPDGYWPTEPTGIDPVALRRAIDDGSAAEIAGTSTRKALERHTYDHRVDLLFGYIETLEHHGRVLAVPDRPIDRFLFDHPYGQRTLDGAGIVADSTREVWTPADLTDDPAPGSFDTVTLDASSPPSFGRSARRFVVGRQVDPVSIGIEFRHRRSLGDLTIVDVGGAGYDVSTVGGEP